VTFLFTDIVGSTGWLKQLGETAYSSCLGKIMDIQREAADMCGGVLVHVDGDGCFFAFSSPVSALDASAAMQSKLSEQAMRGEPDLRVRAGLHRGREVRPVGFDYASLAVHHAARVANAANGGQVLMTEAVAGSTPDRVVDLGLFTLRDFDGPVRLFALGQIQPEDASPQPRALRAGAQTFPAYRTSFVGRADDLAALEREARARRLVTLVGPGGVGKTRLAVEAVAVRRSVLAASRLVDVSAARDRAGVDDALRYTLSALTSVGSADPIEALDALLGSAAAT
jgi:class 3 adenylate cyclase